MCGMSGFLQGTAGGLLRKQGRHKENRMSQKLELCQAAATPCQPNISQESVQLRSQITGSLSDIDNRI